MSSAASPATCASPSSSTATKASTPWWRGACLAPSRRLARGGSRARQGEHVGEDRLQVRVAEMPGRRAGLRHRRGGEGEKKKERCSHVERQFVPRRLPP